jgi:hypothetical protein
MMRLHPRAAAAAGCAAVLLILALSINPVEARSLKTTMIGKNWLSPAASSNVGRNLLVSCLSN